MWPTRGELRDGVKGSQTPKESCVREQQENLLQAVTSAKLRGDCTQNRIEIPAAGI